MLQSNEAKSSIGLSGWIEEVRSQWSPVAPYLNTATYGLPPRVAFDELRCALDGWRHGETSSRFWYESTERARACFARLNGVPTSAVAVGATVSELVGIIAASIPNGAVVLAPEGEFTSLLFPWAANESRGVRIRTVPLRELAHAVERGTTVVAVSAVQSATGEVADLEAISSAARHAGAMVVVDVTQSCGWYPLDAKHFDAVVGAGYKWLMAPRGTAYLYLGEQLREQVIPIHAGWYAGEAGEDLYGSCYGLPMKLASSARRFDTSPAWFSWVGAAPAIELVERLGVDAIHEHNVCLANRFRVGLGLEPGHSAIVSTALTGAFEKLAHAGIRATTRAGSLRASFHLYNTEADVDSALSVLSSSKK